MKKKWNLIYQKHNLNQQRNVPTTALYSAIVVTDIYFCHNFQIHLCPLSRALVAAYSVSNFTILGRCSLWGRGVSTSSRCLCCSREGPQVPVFLGWVYCKCVWWRHILCSFIRLVKDGDTDRDLREFSNKQLERENQEWTRIMKAYCILCSNE